MNSKVAVIGGGFTGLACATALKKRGADVSLFEKNPTLGGLAAGFREPGWSSTLEFYYHHWFKSDAFVSQFASEWGCEAGLVFHRPTTVIETLSHGFVQLDSPLSLLLYPELSLADKLRMGVCLAYLRSTRNWESFDLQTARQWCERFMGKAGFAAIWQPLLEGKFGTTHASAVNMAWLWARLACRTPQLGTFKGGFSCYVDAAEKWLQSHGVKIQKESSNLSVQKLDPGWKVTCQGVSDTFTDVVVAASPGTFAQLCEPYAPGYCAQFKTKASLGVQVVILSLKRKLGRHYWYSLRKTPEQLFLALIEHTNFVPVEEFNGENLVYLANYVDTESAEWALSDSDLVKYAVRTCARVKGDVGENDIFRSWVFREKYAQPVVGVGAKAKTPSIRMDECQGLYHASMAHVYPWDRGTNFALELGQNTAELVLAK